MNGKQRVLRALQGETVDRVPRGEISLEEEFIRALLGFSRRTIIGWVEQRAAIAALDLDLITIDATTGPKGPAADVDRERLRAAGDWRESGLAVMVEIDGPFNRLVRGQGAETASARLSSKRTKPLGAFDQLSMRLRGAVSRAAAAGASAVLVLDDNPEIDGPLLAPEIFRRFYLPQMATLMQAARAYRLPVVLRVEGWHWPILDDLLKLSPAGMQGLAGRPVAEFRARVGPGVCLWGNAGSAWLAAWHSPEEIRSLAISEVVAGLPRYMFGTACGLSGEENIETVLALYDALNEAPVPVRRSP